MSTQETTPKNIILIGFMGCGKSTVGRELHKRLGYSLIDLDEKIEEAAGKKITQIFTDEGEAAFREMETSQLVKSTQDVEQRYIISTGGGVVIREENRAIIKSLGFVVWLHAPEDIIIERTSRSNDRPLLNQANAAQKIRDLMQLREPWYAETAHMKIDTSNLNSTELATGILESARYFFCSK